MRTTACLLLTLTVVAAAPQPTPTPPQSSSSLSPPQHTLASLFTNCNELDISDIEELRRKLNSTIDFDLNGKKENISFGLLEDDWFRLKLLEDRLPVDSLLKQKLLKLFRLVISALFQAHQPSVKVHKTNLKLFENNQLNRTEFNPPNISNNLLNPTTFNQNNVLSTTVITTITDEIDNVAAESEQQESVLPFNTFASPYEIETTTTLHSTNTDWNSNSYKEFNHDSTFLKLPDELLTDNHSFEGDDVDSERTTNYAQNQNNTQKYDPIITEDYQGFNINYENEQNTTSVEAKGGTNNKEDEPKEVTFIEEYDGIIIKPVSDVNNVSMIEVESEIYTISGTEITKVSTAIEEKTSPTSLETKNSDFTNIKEGINDKSSVAKETTGISKEATFTPATNKDSIEDTEKDHGTPYDETESRGGVSEVIHSIESSWSSTVSSETSLSRDSTIQSSSSQDNASEHQYTYNPTDSSSSTARHVDSFDQPINTISYSEPSNYLTTTPSNYKYFNDESNEIYTVSPSTVELTVTISENNSRQDDSLHSTTLSSFSSTQSTKTSLSKTINETFHSFTGVFPEYPKLTSSAKKVNKLDIFSPDRSHRVFFQFERPRIPPIVHAVCKNKNTCVKVQNIEFNNPRNYETYVRPNSFISSKDIRFYITEAESNRKSSDSEDISWWHKIRTLRKKAVEK